MAFRTLDDLDLAGRRVLVRVDINVPVRDGQVSDATRIRAIVPTVEDILARGGKAILLAHFGRPKGRVVPELSLRVTLPALSEALGREVRFAEDCCGAPAIEAIAAMRDGDVLLLENTRFHPCEEKNRDAFAEEMAALGDVYVNDAFSAAHRAHVSTEGIARRLPSAMGRQMQKEIEALERALGDPARPVIAVVGGAKVSTKLDLLSNLMRRVDTLVIGGAMANTFLAAKGLAVGRSLIEADLTGTAREIMGRAAAAGCEIVLPRDLVVARELAANVVHEVVAADACPDDMMILDAGPETVADLAQRFARARTLVWNGPLGAFETPPFDSATVSAARAAAELSDAGRLLSVAGGGDTVAALNAAGVAERFGYVSTAGGAFLEWLEGKTLPGVAALG